jgi:hypothetical protein
VFIVHRNCGSVQRDYSSVNSSLRTVIDGPVNKFISTPVCNIYTAWSSTVQRVFAGTKAEKVTRITLLVMNPGSLTQLLVPQTKQLSDHKPSDAGMSLCKPAKNSAQLKAQGKLR